MLPRKKSSAQCHLINEHCLKCAVRMIIVHHAAASAICAVQATMCCYCSSLALASRNMSIESQGSTGAAAADVHYIYHIFLCVFYELVLMLKAQALSRNYNVDVAINYNTSCIRKQRRREKVNERLRLLCLLLSNNICFDKTKYQTMTVDNGRFVKRRHIS